MFTQWEYGVKIHKETACIWLGIHRIHRQKGVFFDGHDREDVVTYRNDFLQKMEKRDRKSITCEGRVPDLEEGEKPYIRVMHDESTYYANSD